MKIEIQTSLLKGKFGLFKQVVAGARTTVPILTTVMLSVDDGGLTISGTNNEIFVEAWIEKNDETLRVFSAGETCIAFEKAYAFISGIRSPMTTLTLNDKRTRLTINGGGMLVQFPVQGTDEFPDSFGGKNLTYHCGVEVDPNIIADAMTAVSKAASFDPKRGGSPATALYFTRADATRFGDGRERIELAACDSFRFSVGWVDGVFDGEILPDTMFPVRNVAAIANAIADYETVTVRFASTTRGDTASPKVIAFVAESAGESLTAKAITVNTRFFPYRTFLDHASAATINADVDRVELLHALRSAAIFSKDSSFCITLSLSSEGIDMVANNLESGVFSARVQPDWDSTQLGPRSGVNALYNVAYMADALSSNHMGDVVRLYLTDENLPFTIMAANAGELILQHVLMPMHVPPSSKKEEEPVEEAYVEEEADEYVAEYAGEVAF